MKVGWLVVLSWIGAGLASACGGVKESPRPDAAVDAAVDVTVDVSRARCSPIASFGTPMLVPGVNLNTTTDEYNAQLTPDELGMFFVRVPGTVGSSDIYVTTRSAADGDFAEPTTVPNVNTASANEAHPSVTADGLTMFLTSNAAGIGADIFIATRSTLSSGFSAPTPLVAVNSDIAERGDYVLPNGHALYFSRYTPATPLDEVIYRAVLGPAGFDAPLAVAGIKMAPAGLPVLTPDERTIYFVSSSGGIDNNIWTASRANASDPFGTPTKVTELSADGTNEEPSWISADDCVLYFASDRAGSGYDLYVAKRGS